MGDLNSLVNMDAVLYLDVRTALALIVYVRLPIVLAHIDAHIYIA
jgi:hypothetical protein